MNDDLAQAHSARVTLPSLRSMIAATMECPDHTTTGVGLEVELFVYDAQDLRVDADVIAELLDDHPDLTPERHHETSLTGWSVPGGGRLVLEPGAQIEYAGPVRATTRGALEDMRGVIGDLASYIDAHGMTLGSAGLDPLRQVVDQMLDCPRYPAMHTYLGRRSPHGHTMMTGTASIQINLDLGPPDVARDRWHTALLVAPLATAAFASSPTEGAVNGRSVVWQGLDSTRTGFPRGFLRADADPVDCLVDFACQADVLLFDARQSGKPGFTFGQWMREGHPRHGFPTLADAMTHLTTLFPEVRLRGFLEIRSVDALPARWRAVPIVLYSGLLYDDHARRLARRVMEPHREHLPALWDQSARLGLWDPQICAMAVEVWTAAAEGARRLGPDMVPVADINRAERFLDTFTLRGRSPSDELRGLQGMGPHAMLDWAAEPLRAPSRP